MSSYTNRKFEADPEYYEKKFSDEDPQKLTVEFQEGYNPSGLLESYANYFNTYKANKWIGEGNETKRLGREPTEEERRKAIFKSIDATRKLKLIEEFLTQKTATTREFNKWSKTHTEKNMLVDPSVLSLIKGNPIKKKTTKKTKYEKHLEELEKQEQEEEENSLKISIKTDKPKKTTEAEKKKEETKPKKE